MVPRSSCLSFAESSGRLQFVAKRIEQTDDTGVTMGDEKTRRDFFRVVAAGSGAGLALLSGVACGGGSGAAARRDAGETSTDAGADASQPDAGADVGADAAAQQCEVTGSDVEGPFFRDGAPERSVLAPADESGPRIFIEGTVYASDCTTPLVGTLIDVWHADIDGNYGMQPDDYRLRAQLMTDANGRYAFESIRPGNYPMAGTMRPAHIHFMVSKPGHRPLTTQMYFAGDPFLQPNDPCGGCNSGDETLIVDLESFDHQGDEAFRGVFDIVLADG